jgi:predicted O-methyltransferase YrrM
MFFQMKQALRKRLLGQRTQQQLIDDHAALARLGNRDYLEGYPALRPAGFQAPFHAYEFSQYSQNGEDGLLLHLLAKVGTATHFMVEIGTEDGRECNSANLVLNFGWRALLVEMNAAAVSRGSAYFARCGVAERLQFINARALPESINALLAEQQVPTEIDVLSIDIDSHDYWLWQALEGFKPRVVVIEYNASFGPERAVTVPYPAQSMNQPLHRYYHGASLAALCRLGIRKGYVLVGCDSRGVNSFFVRRDLAAAAALTPVSPQQAFCTHRRRGRRMNQANQYAVVSRLPLVEVE